MPLIETLDHKSAKSFRRALPFAQNLKNEAVHSGPLINRTFLVNCSPLCKKMKPAPPYVCIGKDPGNPSSNSRHQTIKISTKIDFIDKNLFLKTQFLAVL